MAVQALVPGTFVCPAVNGEILPVVLRKTCRCPPGVGGMASGAISREIGGQMVWVFCCFKICLMASKAIRRGICKVACDMAGCAIADFVTVGQWEKTMVNNLGIPPGFIDVVAFHTVGGKPGSLVVGVGRGLEFVEVAVEAVVADSVKAQGCFREVAVGAGRPGMCAQQWKPVVLVQLGDIVN